MRKGISVCFILAVWPSGTILKNIFSFRFGQNKMEMINMAKAIASNALVILKFAKVIVEQCVDER